MDPEIRASNSADLSASRVLAHRTARLEQLLAHEGIDRSFIANEPLRNAQRNGVTGFELGVNLTSYRALPLSCLAEIKLAVDDEPIDTSRMLLVLQGNEYRIADLPRLSRVWWFVLDTATLFVARAEPLKPGEHDIDGTLVTVEPYMTAGRFPFYSFSKRRLALELPLAEGAR